MDLESYQRFTDELTHRLRARPEVLGLVAVGSMAGSPDEYSDHDFFVIAEPAHAQGLRDDLDWLPDPDRIVLSFAETAHGVKVLYDGGHLLEFAVFAPDELALARMNRHRVLLDRERVTSRVADVVAATPNQVAAEARDDDYLLGQLLTNVFVGVGRYRRGERLSGRHFVHGQALRHLLLLLSRHVPAERSDLLDNLDPHRRFERAYPALGKELDDALALEVPAAGARLLVIARRELQDRTDFPVKSWDVIRGWTGADPSRS